MSVFKKIILCCLTLLLIAVSFSNYLNTNNKVLDVLADVPAVGGGGLNLGNCIVQRVGLSSKPVISACTPTDRSLIYYNCVADISLNVGGVQVDWWGEATANRSTPVSCTTQSSAPKECFGFTNGSGDKIVSTEYETTPECKNKFKDTCAAVWDAKDNETNSNLRDLCKLPAMFGNNKPSGSVVIDNGSVEVSKCLDTFTAEDDAVLAAKTPPIVKTAGKYPASLCKDGSGKLFTCAKIDATSKKGEGCVALNAAAKDLNKPTEVDSKNGNLGNGLIGIFLALLSIILLVIFYILNWALSFVLWVLGLIFVNILVINPVSVEYIEVAKAPWQILVNMANLLTLASLIFVGIGYILNIKSLKIGIQQLLLNVTIFSLLLNFTLLGLQGLTTITQGVGDAMITARSGQPPAFLSGGQNKLLDSVLIGIQGISLVRCGNANLDGLAIKCQTGTTEAEKANATDTNFGGDFGNLTKAIGGDTLDITAGKIGDKTLRAMLLEVVYTMVLLYTITVMFKGAMMVLIRLVAFWLLLIVSPLALASYFMPVPSIKKYAGQWAEKTWQLAIFYPVAILLLILISEIVSQFAGAINKSIGGAATTATGNAAYLDTVRVYALTGDFGSVFTALLGSILIGVVAAAAFGAMSTFMDKFLGPIAKALGDGIKSAASALGTAGYIGGGAIRMGAGLANKATGGALGAITSRFGGAKTAEKMKSMQDRLAKDRKTLQNRKDRNVMRAERGQSLMNNSALEKKIKSQQRDYIGLKGAVKRRVKFNKGVGKFKGSKFMTNSLKFDGFGKSGFGKFDLSVGSVARGIKSGAPSLGNSLLDTMQFGVEDASNLVATGGLLWKSLGTKRKAQNAERKKRAEGRLEAYLARRQEGNPLYQDLLAYSPELNMLDGKYKPGEEFSLSDEEVKKLIDDESRRHGDKVGGINRDTTLGQAKKLIAKYQEAGYKNLNTIQRNNLRDIYEKAEKDKSFAEALSLDTENQNFLAENAYSMLGSVGIKSFAKAAPQLLANNKGGVGSEDQNSSENIAIRDELQSFARSYAQASPDSELRRNMNASSLIANPVIMETIDAINPDLGKEMRKKNKLDGDFNASYSQVEAYKEAGKYRESDPEMYQGIVSSASSRASNGYSSTPQLRVRLAQAGSNTAEQETAYKQFYTDEYGTETVSKDSINGLTLEQLKNSNLGRTAIAKLPKFDQLSEAKQREYLVSNAQAAWGAFGRTENSFKQGNTLNVKEASDVIESSQNRVGLAEANRGVQVAVARVASNGGASQIRQLRENGNVISSLNRYNLSAPENQRVDLEAQINQAIEEVRVAELTPLQEQFNVLNAEALNLNTGIQALELERGELQSQLVADEGIINSTDLNTIQSQRQGITSQIEGLTAGDTRFGTNSSQRISQLQQTATSLDSQIANFQEAQTRSSRRAIIDTSIANSNEQLVLANASVATKQAEIEKIQTSDASKLGEDKVLKRVQTNSNSYLQGVVSSSGGKFTSSDAQSVNERINAKDVSLADIKMIGANQRNTNYAQDLSIQDGDKAVSYEVMLSVPEVNTVASKTFKILRENRKIGDLDLSADGSITSSVTGSFEEGAFKILSDLTQSIEKGEDYDVNKFKAALSNPSNASWANTVLGEQLGNMMGFENKANSSGVIELTPNPDSKGIFTRKALLRKGEETSNKLMSQASQGYKTIEAGIIDVSGREAKAASEAVTAQQTAGLTRDTEDNLNNLVRVLINNRPPST